MAQSVAYPILVMMEETARNREICAFLEREPLWALRYSGIEPRQAEMAMEATKPKLVLVMAEAPSAFLKEWMNRISEKSGIPFLVLRQEEPQAREHLLGTGLVQSVRSVDSLQATVQELNIRIRLAVNHAAANQRLKMERDTARKLKNCINGRTIGPDKLIAVGASMGGVEALSRVLEVLPSEMPGIVVVQHMPKGFTEMYAKRLDQSCKLKVVHARDQQRVENGTVYIAPGSFQMEIAKSPQTGYFIRVSDGEKVSGHKPSVNVLFRSVAKCAGKNALGIILTGMGDDGARGLLEMRGAGADTAGQDAGTSLVYGMPKVAYELGAVRRQLPLMEVPHYMIEYAYR